MSLDNDNCIETNNRWEKLVELVLLSEKEKEDSEYLIKEFFKENTNLKSKLQDSINSSRKKDIEIEALKTKLNEKIEKELGYEQKIQRLETQLSIADISMQQIIKNFNEIIKESDLNVQLKKLQKLGYDCDLLGNYFKQNIVINSSISKKIKMSIEKLETQLKK